MNRCIWISALLILLWSTAACSLRESEPERGMYYWDTTFELDSLKRDFLARHRVTKLYVRYFDVVADEEAGESHPNATIRFDSVEYHLPQEVVPVVFVLPDALTDDNGQLAAKILSRVKQMSETHGLGPVKEVQIDCDWTRSTRNRFFNLMSHLKELTLPEGITLSSTIRLHQLAGPPPPADRGVLMVYNTGDLRSLSTHKPILDPDDVEPYLKHLAGFDLPLATAYPIYRWDLLFRNGKFVDIIHQPGDLPVMSSDSIVARQPLIADILAAKNAIEAVRPECRNEILLFDLNNYNLQRYDSQEFEDIFD